MELYLYFSDADRDNFNLHSNNAVDSMLCHCRLSPH